VLVLVLVRVLGIAGAVGVVYTHFFRYKIRSDPQLRAKYMDSTPVAKTGSVVMLKKDWSPLKKWSILFLIGTTLGVGLIAVLMLFARWNKAGAAIPATAG
jgi:uncharacterized ion transporter superfamily protein YfcC